MSRYKKEKENPESAVLNAGVENKTEVNEKMLAANHKQFNESLKRILNHICEIRKELRGINLAPVNDISQISEAELYGYFNILQSDIYGMKNNQAIYGLENLPKAEVILDQIRDEIIAIIYAVKQLAASEQETDLEYQIITKILASSDDNCNLVKADQTIADLRMLFVNLYDRHL